MSFPDHDDPDRPAFMAGYRQGESERIALATANSELRSQVLALTARLEGGSGVIYHADAPHLPAGQP